jgi:hypothetical protein
MLNTAEAVFKELGTAEVRRLTGASMSAVSNWRADKQFPPKTYVALKAALALRDCSAPIRLWGMIKPPVMAE